MSSKNERSGPLFSLVPSGLCSNKDSPKRPVVESFPPIDAAVKPAVSGTVETVSGTIHCDWMEGLLNDFWFC